MPKVSIVLPNYNYARYLDERIQSLLNQTYKDFELIILDDASTDNSLEVIEKYTSDPRVKTQFYTENSGLPYKRWNDGADLAQGEYLLIAGADDSCHPTLLENLVEKLDHNPSVALAFSQSWDIDSEGRRIRSWKEHTDSLDENRWAKDFIDSGNNELQYLVFLNTIPNASAVLMRREVFIKAGKFDPQLRVSADWMLWAKMLTIGNIAFISEPLNYFRTHAQTVRSTTQKNALYVWEEYQVLKSMLENTNFSEQVVTKTLEQKADVWVGKLVLGGGVSLKRNIKIYGIASSIDGNIKQRLTKKILALLVMEFKQKVLRRIKYKFANYLYT